MWPEFEDVGSLKLDTDKFDDLLAPQWSDDFDVDSDDFDDDSLELDDGICGF